MPSILPSGLTFNRDQMIGIWVKFQQRNGENYSQFGLVTRPRPAAEILGRSRNRSRNVLAATQNFVPYKILKDLKFLEHIFAPFKGITKFNTENVQEGFVQVPFKSDSKNFTVTK